MHYAKYSRSNLKQEVGLQTALDIYNSSSLSLSVSCLTWIFVSKLFDCITPYVS